MARRTKQTSWPSDLDRWWGEAIEAVASGSTTTLDLGTSFRLGAPDALPDEVRTLHNLEILILGAEFTTLPAWLSELPRLKVIRATRAMLASVPALPGVTWGLDAETLWNCSDTIRPDAVHWLRISPETSKPAILHALDLAQSSAMSLRELQVQASVMNRSESATREQWKNHAVIKSTLDDLLRTQDGLETAYLWGSALGRVPEALSDLRTIHEVALAGVWPKAWPDWLFSLPELKRLDLSFNELTDLPASIGEAQQLTELNLWGNAFTRVPEGVWNLSALESLGLEECPLVEIPAEILRLDRLQTLEIGSFTDSSALPDGFISPPPEIAAQGLDAIKSYWRQQREVGIDYLAEAKLLIVGEPGAGKTTLARMILDPTYVLDPDEKSTEGIAVDTWQFPSAIRVQSGGGQQILQVPFRANVWDFGGQEIYHATHQFFLTRRSLYVLVTDERKEDTDFEYWLDVVNLLSDSSPVIIVQNQKQGRRQGIDFGDLRRRYANLRQPLTVNLADPPTLQPALAEIRRELEQLPHIGTPLPKTWRDVRVALKSDERDHISADQFFELCTAHGFRRRDDMIQLAGYLHDLGICLFFQDDDLLSRTVILKPEWGTGAVYRVLDDPSIARNLGVFGRGDLRRIWHEPAYSSMRAELLQLMLRFGLCYQVPGSDTFVAPQLLSPTKPAYTWDDSDNLVMRYEYDVMPKGIVRRLIVALHDLIPPGEHVWRTGALLERDLTQAELIEDYRRRRLTIRLRGGDPRVLLAIIERELDTIHRSYPAIRFEKLRPCDCEACAASAEPSMFTIRELLEFARDGDQIQCRLSRTLRDPAVLLRGLYVDQERAKEPVAASLAPRPVQPEVFVSYKWGGQADALVDELQQRMSELGVTVTRDRDEIRYRDSIEQFMRRLGTGKAIVIVLDKGYLQSKNCMFELTRIAKDPQFATRVFPIVWEDAGILDPLDRLEYVQYWEEKRNALDQRMRAVGQENLHGIREELDLYEDIRNTIAAIMDVIADMNVLTVQAHRGDGFAALYASLGAARDKQAIQRT